VVLLSTRRRKRRRRRRRRRSGRKTRGIRGLPEKEVMVYKE
jgi:hypothetical protein